MLVPKAGLRHDCLKCNSTKVHDTKSMIRPSVARDPVTWRCLSDKDLAASSTLESHGARLGLRMHVEKHNMK